MNISGRIVEIFDTVELGEKKFKKREFVIEYAKNPKYPELVKFELNQDKCALVDCLHIGDDVDVEFDIGGRKWTDRAGVLKYFNSVKAWKVTRIGNQAQEPEPLPPPVTPQPMPTEDEMNLPF